MSGEPNGNGNGVTVNRLRVSIEWFFSGLVGAVGATVALFLIRSEDLSTIAKHEQRVVAIEAKISSLSDDLLTRIKSVDDKVLGDKYPGWHRSTMLTWCLFTERENPGWLCYDPYLIPLPTQAEPGHFLHPSGGWGATISRQKPRK